MSFMCTSCFEDLPFYKIDMKLEYHPYDVGDCTLCKGTVVEMDDMIIDSIIILNKKGWTTEFCCSGHLSESYITTYIKFIHTPNTTPFQLYKDGDCIRMPIILNEGIEGFETLLNANLDIYKWAVGLPIRE